MQILSFSQISKCDWDQVVLSSDEGWLFSTHSWQKLAENVPSWFVENCSFGVELNGGLAAVCPLQYNGTPTLHSGFPGSSSLIVLQSLSPAQREKVFQFAINHVKTVARQKNATHLECHISPLSKFSIQNVRGVNPLVEFGFEDISTHSWIVDLSPPLEEVYNSFSRAAKREIQEAEAKGYSVREILSRKEIELYYVIHQETYARTGATPFPKEYFLGIQDYIATSGNVQTLVVLNSRGDPVAFSNIGVFKNQALYWTVCCKNADHNQGVYYLIVWYAIKCSKERGNQCFETSEAFPNAREGTKLKGLNDFKRKFGGKLFRYYKGRLDLRPTTDCNCETQKPASKPFALSQIGQTSTILKEVREILKPTLGPLFKKIQPLARFLRKGSFIPYLKPFWHKEEKQLLRHPEKCATHALENCEQRLRTYFSLPQGSFLGLSRSGRVALSLTLKCLMKVAPERKTVVLPTYCCLGVVLPILQHGLVPVFVDINDNLLGSPEGYLRALNSQVLATIIIHSGGQTHTCSEVIRKARELGVFIIQDHCQNVQPLHPMLNRDHSDVDIFSFGLGKNLMATAGGAFCAHILQDSFEEEYQSLPHEEPQETLLRAGFCWHKFFGLPISCSLSSPQGNTGDPSAGCKMSGLDAAILEFQISKSSYIISKRKQNSSLFNQILLLRPDLFRFPLTDKAIFTKNSIIVSDIRQAKLFSEFCNQRNFELENMYVPLHLREKTSAYREELFFPVSETLWRKVRNIPVRPNLSDSEIHAIASALKDFVSAHD